MVGDGCCAAAAGPRSTFGATTTIEEDDGGTTATGRFFMDKFNGSLNSISRRRNTGATTGLTYPFALFIVYVLACCGWLRGGLNATGPQ